MTIFRYDWSQFNAKLGLIFMIAALMVFNLMGRFDFAVYAAGISALLAWITIILVPHCTWRQHISGLVVYLIAGTALVWLAALTAASDWARLVSIAIVTFAGYLVLLRGAHSFMVAWCLVYWYLLIPLFLGDQDAESIMLGHILGVGVVIGLNLLKPVWSRATKKAEQEEISSGGADQDQPTLGFVVRYASIVSLSIVFGMGAGAHWITSDPTLIANATINMISPSLQQTWHAAIERIVMGTLGIVGGFYFGWYFPDPWVGQFLMIICCFLALGSLYVNMQIVIGILFFLISYSWGAMQSDTGHLIANEKLIGEFIGVLVAVVAIAILSLLKRKGKPNKVSTP